MDYPNGVLNNVVLEDEGIQRQFVGSTNSNIRISFHDFLNVCLCIIRVCL